MKTKLAVFVSLMFITIFSFCSTVLSSDESKNKTIVISDINKMVLYYMPINLETYSRVTRDSLINNNYFYKVEINQMGLSNIKNLINNINSEKIIISRNESINYRVVVEFWGDDSILFEYALGYNTTNMEINGNIIKAKKIYYELVYNILPFYEEKASLSRVMSKLD